MEDESMAEEGSTVVTICAQCKHGFFNYKFHYYECYSNPAIDFVSGVYVPFKCHEKNTDGQCPEFEQKEIKPSLWRRLLG
jgi:hypothetical protein